MGNPKAPKHKELSVEQLRWKCNPDLLELSLALILDRRDTIFTLRGYLGLAKQQQ